jgi:hypothetical protein
MCMFNTYLHIMMRKYFSIIVDDFSFLGGGYRLLFVFGGKDIYNWYLWWLPMKFVVIFIFIVNPSLQTIKKIVNIPHNEENTLKKAKIQKMKNKNGVEIKKIIFIKEKLLLFSYLYGYFCLIDKK